jgi:hypothetical protein
MTDSLDEKARLSPLPPPYRPGTAPAVPATTEEVPGSPAHGPQNRNCPTGDNFAETAVLTWLNAHDMSLDPPRCCAIGSMTRCFEGRFCAAGQPAYSQVRRHIGLSGSGRYFRR